MNETIKYVNIDGKKKAVRKFELTCMASNPAIILIAKRRSGKSWVCRDIIRHLKNIPCGIIIAKSEKKADEPFYSEFFPDSFIYYEYESKILEKLFDRQNAMIKKAKQKKEHGVIIDPRAIFVMDDCLSDKGTWTKDPLIYELMFNGRHYKISYILTMQTPLGIKPELRSNFDYFFLLAEDNVGNLKRIYENYAGFFRNLNAFITTFKQLTADHGAMVIANVGANEDMSKKVYWYKATDIKIGIVGCKQFINVHNNNYKENWDEN